MKTSSASSKSGDTELVFYSFTEQNIHFFTEMIEVQSCVFFIQNSGKFQNPLLTTALLQPATITIVRITMQRKFIEGVLLR